MTAAQNYSYRRFTDYTRASGFTRTVHGQPQDTKWERRPNKTMHPMP